MQSELTLFHAKSPREPQKARQRFGTSRWGPELQPYLEHIVDLLGIGTGDGVEIPLAMIYLDRACSVETQRSSGIPPCPYCTPRTVHRLSLVALVVAAQAVHGGTIEQYHQRIESLGIPLPQLQQMVDWMKGALGDPGLLVTVRQMKQWSQTWDAIFSPKRRLQLQLEQRQISQPSQIYESYHRGNHDTSLYSQQDPSPYPQESHEQYHHDESYN